MISRPWIVSMVPFGVVQIKIEFGFELAVKVKFEPTHNGELLIIVGKVGVTFINTFIVSAMLIQPVELFSTVRK